MVIRSVRLSLEAGCTANYGSQEIHNQNLYGSLSEEYRGPGKNLRESSSRPQNMRGIILDWSRIMDREEKLDINNANHYVIVTPVGNN
ncbi:MAG: hypothetical protein KAI93_14290 [Desulfobacterales bacterium]|nr:hypothetical protein [Desulfobacterales bacterium]